MTNITFFLIFVPILATVLLLINFVLAPHLPDKNKDAQFECGFSSFTQMSRLPFSVSFFVYALLFLLFDLEILLVYPYVVSAYNNSIYGLVVMLVFFILLTIGFVFELGKKALQIDSRQTDVSNYNNPFTISKAYGIICILPSLFIRVYVKYPNLTQFLTLLVLSLIIQWCNSAYIYCDSSSEPLSDSEDKSIVVHDSNTDVSVKGKGKTVHWADPISTSSDNTANTDTKVDVKGKGKAIYQEDDYNTGPNTDSNLDTSKRPFTMDRSLKDFWENSYDDDDRRRHYTVLDRLGITAEQWEDDYFDRVGSINVIKREMDILKAQEEEDSAIARKIVESLEDEDKAISKQIAESLEGSEDSKKRKLEESLQADEDMARKLQKSLYEADPSSKIEPSIEAGPSTGVGSYSEAGPSTGLGSYSKAGPSSEAGPSNEVGPSKPVDSDSDSDSDYSVLSSIRGDESPKTYQKKLEVLEVEFNLKKKD